MLREERERVLVSSGRVQTTNVHAVPLTVGDPGNPPANVTRHEPLHQKIRVLVTSGNGQKHSYGEVEGV